MTRPDISPGITAILCPDPALREAFASSLCGGGGMPPFRAGGGELLVSAKQALAVVEAQEALDDSDYTDGAVYQGAVLSEFLSSFGPAEAGALSAMGLSPLLGRGIRFLSNGEMRKALSMAALSSAARLIVFDDPYDGLDPPSREALLSAVEDFAARNPASMAVLLFERRDDLPPSLRRRFLLCPSGLLSETSREAAEYLEGLERESHAWNLGLRGEGPDRPLTPGEALIEMRGVELAYDGRRVFSLPAWRVREGEHWLIQGPNGCGKSSLLGMICGDNVKAYGQDVRLFGKRKGSGESVWELKRDIGAVSRELHLRYRVDLPLEEVVVSGCFDTIGLYEKPTRSQSERARELCRAAGWGPEESSRGFSGSPYAVQRLALILRALVKEPRLLILDEPCQGLDDAHRDAFLGSLSALVSRSRVTSLYVTHRKEEIPSHVTDVLRFRPAGAGYACAEEKPGA